MNRFNIDNTCKCDRIKDDTCKQCSCCDVCEYFKHEEIPFMPVLVGNGFYNGGHYIRLGVKK